MLAQDICWIEVTRYEMEEYYSSCNGLAHSMERKNGMAFVEFGMHLHGTVDNRLIVTKHVTPFAYGNSKVAKSVAEVNDLFNTGASGHKFGTIGGSFNSSLLSSVPVDGQLVEEMEDTGD